MTRIILHVFAFFSLLSILSMGAMEFSSDHYLEALSKQSRDFQSQHSEEESNDTEDDSYQSVCCISPHCLGLTFACLIIGGFYSISQLIENEQFIGKNE